MANRLLKRMAFGILVCEVLLLPVYAQKDATDDSFSFDRLAEMEKRLERAPEAEKTVLVVENATNGVSDRVSEPVLDEKTAFPAVSGRSMNMWRSLGALLIVLGGLIVANKWLQRRISGRSGASGGVSGRRMVIQERLALDHKRQLVLVTVGRRELVLALGPNEMRPVAEWECDEEDAEGEVEA